MAKMDMKSILFLIGIGGGAVLGLLQGFGINFGLSSTFVLSILAVLGVIIGFMNVSAGESSKFMLAVLVLGIAATALGTLVFAGRFIEPALINLSAVAIPAGSVVALKELISTTRR